MKLKQLFLSKSLETVSENWLTSPGVIGTIVLVFIIVILGLYIFLKRLNLYVDLLEKNSTDLTEEEFERRLVNLDKEEVDSSLELRKQGFKPRVRSAEIDEVSSKHSGFIKKIINPKNPLFDEKTKSTVKIEISESLKKIIIWYICNNIII